ncbi:hypothetical protein M406DRAFT_291085 [Cryphonectria parasitica EP155]|uniref:DUF1275 domain protein n=1 Tax=Cryphonectria parasitica (strain ATCC 38755 / EP155) TaxID=660469 RepID=A0A9P5CQZ4_CRYP1|nr:uncharacterized protein M406DRAFT_291085 [Cryphonectria parasitica EP155]KAF3766595.1 hypothetical protein M406DRAFT_291085 [Cryphonectria parasitica EP155]
MQTQSQAEAGNASSDSQSDRSFVKRSLQQLRLPVDGNLANLPLLACCFITGLLDTTMFEAYGTFVSMQTGNTIFLALGGSNQNNKPYDWARSLCSIGCFAIGALFFSRFYRRLSPGQAQRGSLSLGFLIQAVCVCLAAALIQAGTINERQSSTGATDWREIAPIALLSFQAAGQIVASRVLAVNELPTVVITSLLCDLMSDPKLVTMPIFHGNRKRNNRIAGFVLTLVGSILGGWMLKGTGEVQPVLWLVCGIKFTISFAWLIWKVDQVEEDSN